jgi:hypothetical protein
MVKRSKMEKKDFDKSGYSLERFYDLVTLRTVFNNMVCPQG